MEAASEQKAAQWVELGLRAAPVLEAGHQAKHEGQAANEAGAARLDRLEQWAAHWAGSAQMPGPQESSGAAQTELCQAVLLWPAVQGSAQSLAWLRAAQVQAVAAAARVLLQEQQHELQQLKHCLKPGQGYCSAESWPAWAAAAVL